MLLAIAIVIGLGIAAAIYLLAEWLAITEMSRRQQSERDITALCGSGDGGSLFEQLEIDRTVEARAGPDVESHSEALRKSADAILRQLQLGNVGIFKGAELAGGVIESRDATDTTGASNRS
jgi:hypothetical protein